MNHTFPMPAQEPRDLFHGGGETGDLLRKHDWSSTALGPVEHWPQSLKTTIRIMMTSQQPIWVSWGAEMTYFYNDAYRSVVGGKHPKALTRSVLEVWPELTREIKPMLDKAMVDREGVFVEEQLFIMERNGYPEETYYTFSYSPVPDDDGKVGGIICANADDTQKIISRRQLQTLQKLAQVTVEIRDVHQACGKCLEGLRDNNHDILFALLYLPDASTETLVRQSQLGFDAMGSGAEAKCIDALESVLPLSAVSENKCEQLLELAALGVELPLPTGAWQQPCEKAVLLPIEYSAEDSKCGVLVLGLNPFRLFDESYRGFVQVLANQIEGTIANVLAFVQERQRAEALADIDRAKTLFFSNVSHEFRTPLTLMLGPLEQVLAKHTLDKSSYSELKVALRNSKRLLKLVNTLLDFSRVEAGRMKAVFRPVELDRFTLQLASHFFSAFSIAGLKLELDCPPLSVPIFIDSDMWEKIVFNLLSNAFKYTFAGGVKLVIREYASTIEMQVIDTGIGIPQNELSNIFQRFHRVENARGRSFEGSGIGLALVSELVALHSGHLTVSSTLGEGSVFSVTMPKGRQHLDADQILSAEPVSKPSYLADGLIDELMHWLPESRQNANPASPLEDAATPKDFSDQTGKLISDDQQYPSRPLILIADDNSDMRHYIASMLNSKYEVSTVADGVQALNWLRANTPDLLISDVMMPNLDGVSLVQAIRKDIRIRSLPVILLSARAGEEAEIEGISAGADEYLVKPFSSRELIARVDSILAIQKLRQEQENHFRIIADYAPGILWMSAADGGLTYLSHQWYEMTGGRAPDDLQMKWMEKIHEADRPRIQTEYSQHIMQETAFRLYYRLQCSQGQYRWVINAGVPRYFQSDGNQTHEEKQGKPLLGFVGSVFDVSDRIEAEEKLKELDRRKDEFLATLAHELRNPLAPIGNAVNILQLTDDKVKAKSALRSIERQLQHLVRLVDDLMDVSRITRGKVALRKDVINLKNAMDSVVEAILPVMQAKKQVLNVDVPNEKLLLHGDLTRISQIFSNILNNASKYTKKGGQIDVRVRADKHQVRVEIQDNGIGIPEEKRDVIFDMFLQLDSSLQRMQGGLGIGLTLVKQLVLLHNGEIQVNSEGKDKGSTFTVSFPRVLNKSLCGSVDVQETSLSVVALRILVVDDNEESAVTLTQLLNLAGHECRCEFRGQNALARLTDFHPHVMLLDIGMPEMDGYEVCRTIKQDKAFQKIICIAQTGWGESKHVARAKQAGFDFHLVKPVDFSQLNDILSSIEQQRH
ncbi:Sensor histidine kinase TmoS [Thalassocella blandensis]|nr:Sensor histidine kinase TmoS [Thalassocella blandensis]